MAPQLLVVGAIIALVVYGAYWAKKKERERTEAIGVAAKAMGFTFVETDALPHGGELPLFNRGYGRVARNLMTGATAGHPVEVMDYQFTIGSGKNRQTYRQTVVLFNDGTSLPDFELGPENFFHKIGQAFGYQDIDFESNEDFSKHYLLRGKEEARIRSVFGPALLSLLAGEPGWSAQAHGGRLVVYRTGRMCEPAQLPAFLADCLRIAGNFTG